MPHMNARTFTCFALIFALLLAAAVASLASGGSTDPLPRPAATAWRAL